MQNFGQFTRRQAGAALYALVGIMLISLLTGCGSSGGGVSPTYVLTIEKQDSDGTTVTGHNVVLDPAKTQYSRHDSVTLTAEADPGWQLVAFKDKATNEPVTMPIIMTSSLTIIAVFDINPGEFAYGTGSADDPFLIGTPDQLHNVRDHLNKHFRLIRDLDMAGFGDGAAGWQPIGSGLNDTLTGTFDGNGYVIRNLLINRPQDFRVGLFGYAGGEIANVVLEDAQIVGNGNVGALVGEGWGMIRDSSVIGTSRVEGTSNVGGLVGWLYGGTVERAYTTGIVHATGSSVGGMVGRSSFPTIKDSVTEVVVKMVGSVGTVGGFVGHQEFGIIQDCQALGSLDLTDITFASRIGGFVGSIHQDSLVKRCHADVDVVTSLPNSSIFGGFVGQLNDGVIKQSSAVGAVTANERVGGFVGWLNSGTIEDSYAHGHATAAESTVGGFVGEHSGGRIDRCYSVGPVTPARGFFGTQGKAVISSSHYNRDTGGERKDQVSLARTTPQLQVGTPGEYVTPTGDFDRGIPPSISNLMYDKWSEKVWDFGSPEDYPTFHWQ